MATLWSCYGCCISEERGCVTAAMPAGENKSVWGSCHSSSLLQPLNSSLAFPGFSEDNVGTEDSVGNVGSEGSEDTVGSEDSVGSRTISVTNSFSNTLCLATSPVHPARS